MDKWFNKTSWIIALLTGLVLQIINWRINYIFWLPVFLILFLAGLAWFLVLERPQFYRCLVWLVSVFNFLAWLLFLTLINSSGFRYGLIVVAAISQWWYWQKGFSVWQGQKNILTWQRVVNVLNLITIWLLAATLYGWQSFLAWPIMWLLVVWLLASGLIILADYYILKVDIKNNWPMMLATWLILGQLFVIIYFLPSSNLVLGYLLSSAYYVFGQIGRNSLLKINTTKRLRYQLTILLVSLVVIILTAKWF